MDKLLRPFSLCILICSLMAPAALLAQDTRAMCNLRFSSTWSAATHPGSFPPNAHFSPLVGGTHNNDVSFWQAGATATPGIKSMAETGATGLLAGEVGNAVTAGTAAQVILGPDIPVSPGNAELDFELDLAHPLVSVVSMIAPSPDWFVGVHGLSLLQNGHWAPSLSVDLPPYDAGTDSGANFLSPNAPTIPQGMISRLMVTPFPAGGSLGTFTFTCVSDLTFLDGFESGDLEGWGGG